MNHTKYDKLAQNLKSWEDKRADEAGSTIEIICYVAVFCLFWGYLMYSITDWFVGL